MNLIKYVGSSSYWISLLLTEATDTLGRKSHG